VEQLPGRHRHKAIGVEDIFLKFEAAVPAVEVIHTIFRHPLAQDQVLGAGWGTDRVRLNEAQFAHRPSKRCCAKERRRNRMMFQIPQTNHKIPTFP
jgi:hypothetical protein